MGAWGYRTFENDYAMDWVADLEMPVKFTKINNVLYYVFKSKDYLGARECSIALAAIEIVAASKTGDNSQLPEKLQSTTKKDFYSFNFKNSVICIDKILSLSELKDLWKENDALYPKWVETLTTLRNKLS